MSLLDPDEHGHIIVISNCFGAAQSNMVNSWGTRQRGYDSERTAAAGVFTVFKCLLLSFKKKLNVVEFAG